jgi:signal transduction histidine kinase/ActR/RegA family two-component response regulator
LIVFLPAFDDVMLMSTAKFNHAPSTNWAEMCDTEHFVQFYEADGSLLNSISGFIGNAISAGEGAVVVATQAHRDGLDQLLQSNGLDVVGAKSRGRYLSLDASETLSKFMVDGLPDPQRFNEVIGGVIASVTDGDSRIRAFGEMVSLLWAEGNQAAAIRLEELWNDLQTAHSFSLFCAYPLRGLGGERLIEPTSSICKVHSRVIPAESYVDLSDPVARLREIAVLQQKAESLESEVKERREVEERLRRALAGEQVARAEAETANRMKDEFLATVSHEIRTPLNAIIGWSHLLRSGNLDAATTARAVETIDRNAKSQAQLIEDILDVSRMITGKLRLNNEPVDIAAVVNAAIDSVQLAIDSKNLTLEETLDPSARHTLGDANRLQQVVWNLLSNAIKFTPAGGNIEVKLKRAGTDVQLMVSDNGDGKGACFTINLPLAPTDGTRRRNGTGKLYAAALAQEKSASLPSLQDVKVLLVDDDADTLQILAVMLAESKAGLQTARSAKEALEMLEWYQPDVIVSDLAMPGEDGYSLIGRVRALASPTLRQIPAVALTSYVRIEDRTRALSAGFNMFVPKPVQPAELVSAIASLAESETSSAGH